MDNIRLKHRIEIIDGEENRNEYIIEKFDFSSPEKWESLKLRKFELIELKRLIDEKLEETEIPGFEGTYKELIKLGLLGK